jgi:hypothetical protein
VIYRDAVAERFVTGVLQKSAEIMEKRCCFRDKQVIIAKMLFFGDQYSVFADKGSMTDLQLDVFVIFRVIGIKGL